MLDLTQPMTQSLIAQALQGGGNQNVGTGLARLATVFLANMAQKKATEKDEQTRKQDIARILQASTGTPYDTSGNELAGPPGQPDQRQIAAALLQSSDPKFQQIGIQQMFPQAGMAPSNVQEWQYYKSLSPEDQARYIEMKRAQQKIDTGSEVILAGQGGKPMATYQKTLTPSQQPMNIAAGEQAKEVGKQAGQAAGGIPVVGPAQLEMDKTFAKEIADFEAGGGFSDTQKGIQQLNDVLGALRSGENLTGPGIGSIPGFAQPLLTPKAVARREDVEEVVQRNLRLILGAQFTEKEGERLIARAYNPRLSEEENARRVERLIKQISGAALAKQEAIEYFKQNGTLQGFRGKIYSAADFDPDAMFGADATTDSDIDSLINKYAD